MMVFRYPLKIEDYQEVSVPTAYQVLSCAPARDQYAMENLYGPPRLTHGIDLWIKVGPSHLNTDLWIYIVGTGNPMPEHPRTGGSLDLNFIGTCVMPNDLVWHVFVGPTKAEISRGK